MTARSRAGFTLVELLVVISIIGILMSMLMPAVQQARESARRVQCKNNLNNIAKATLLHVSNHKFYPTGGWGWGWAGDPDRGFTRKQPGGWMYNILPYMEEAGLHDLGKGQADAQKRAAGVIRVGTAISLFNCPTRRRPEQTPYIHGSPYYNINMPKLIARTDYAGNGGDTGFRFNGNTKGPDVAALKWTSKQIDDASIPENMNSSGIISLRSEWTSASVKDGESKTYLAGERYLYFSTYDTGSPADDDQGWDVAYDWDNVRWTNQPPLFDQVLGTKNDGFEFFGSAHQQVFNMAFCDGSVTTISYEMDPNLHRVLGHRRDAQTFGGKTYDMSDIAR